MSFRQELRVSRTVFVAFSAVLLLGTPATAGSGHGHRSAPVAAAPSTTGIPRLTASSESYELNGSLKDGVLSLRLKRKPNGSSVSDAHIELTIDGESGEASAVGSGGYTYRSAALNSAGEHEVIVTIKDGKKSDLLIGVLKAGQDHGDHAGHADLGGDKGHVGHDDHGAESAVKLTPEVMQEFGVTTKTAGPGTIAHSITRPAEISFNMDRFTHVVPRVAGIANSIKASQGDRVKSDQILAVLESRELAELKAAYLAALERLELAKDDFERAQTLRKKNVTSQRSFLSSRSAFAEARIAMRSAKQKLNSIGIDDDLLTTISKKPDSILTHYTMRAPMSGMIVKRHLVQGELVTSEREAFTIADTSSVWINISLYSGDLPNVDTGQKVTLETETGQTAEGKISFVSPDVSEQTRTATARVVLKGLSRIFRPGMFIKAKIALSKEQVALRIPKSALHTKDGKQVVFVNAAGEFKPRPVKIGRRNGKYAEVTSGLKSGEVIAAAGSFLIKSQLSKASFGDGHNH